MLSRKDARHPNRLLVEGKDLHALIALTARHGFDYDNAHSEAPFCQGMGGWEPALGAFTVALRSASLARVGLVLDADGSPRDRWRSVRARLLADHPPLRLPEEPPAQGWVGDVGLGMRAGVWLMPDNQSPGRLEELLLAMLPPHDRFWPLAERAVAEARAMDAPFREVDTLKAQLATWLAWQDPPGRPYGIAIRAGRLPTDPPAALAFVEWFRRLFRETTTPVP